MALVDTRYMVEKYIDDFGNIHDGIFFKIQPGAPALDKFYKKRGGSICGASTAFDMRYLQCIFADGRQLKYPVPSIKIIDDILRELKASSVDEAIPGVDPSELVCAHLFGEKWTNVLPGTVGLSSVTFKNTPYNNIQKRGLKTTGTFTYLSDVDGIGYLTMGYSVEKEPSDLASCQKEGMANLTEGKGICSTAALGIKPRQFIIQALRVVDTNSIFPGGKEYGQVSRKVNVSGYDENILPGSKLPKKVYENIAKCAYCIGWEGESVRNVHNYVGRNSGLIFN